MKLTDHFRSTSFRMAIGYASLFAVSVLLIFVVTYQQASSDMRRALRASILAEVQEFNEVFEKSGIQELADDVSEQSLPGSRELYLLRDQSGKEIAGNLDVSEGFLGWKEWRRPGTSSRGGNDEPEDTTLFIGWGGTIGPATLVVAANADALEETQEVLLRAFGWGALATVLTALLGGFLLGRGPIRRVEQIAQTTRAIVAGQFGKRVPPSDRSDEIARLSSDINTMLDRIEQLVVGLKQISSDIAHDLRTPLTRLRQRLDTARRGRVSSRAYLATIDAAIGDVDTINRTFDALLRVAQIEAGERRSKFTETDLSDLLRNVVDIYSSVAEDAGHVLSSSIEPGARVNGDPDLLTQLFANLIENAVRHVPRGGRIAVELTGLGGRIVCKVGDNGPGIPAEERSRVFRRLYRLERSRTTPGAGLGLSLVKAIADLHGAAIRLDDNNPGLVVAVEFDRFTPDG
jgi:signal transduction histidine kinase